MTMKRYRHKQSDVMALFFGSGVDLDQPELKEHGLRILYDPEHGYVLVADDDEEVRPIADGDVIVIDAHVQSPPQIMRRDVFDFMFEPVDEDFPLEDGPPEFGDVVRGPPAAGTTALGAYEGACAVAYFMQDGAPSDDTYPGAWPMLGAMPKLAQGESFRGRMAPLVDVLATFVRENPTAPVEALYRHAQMTKVHAGPADGWAAQPLWVRAAFEVFRDTLVACDRLLEAHRRAVAIAAAQDARPPRARFVDPEETMFERTTGPLDRVSFARQAPPIAPPAAFSDERPEGDKPAPAKKKAGKAKSTKA